jgi:hypothetical protein
MDELHDQYDKLSVEVDHLDRVMDCDHDQLDAQRVTLALAIAKRVRRESTLLVRRLASRRDELQP